jgi:hypothetical protein
MAFERRPLPGLAAVAVLLVLFGSVSRARADEEVAALDGAIGRYWDGLFSEAVEALEPLADSLEGEEEILAREYLARALVRLGEEDRGRAAFKALLRIRPDWRPDAKVVAGPEMSAFEAALEQYENENLGALSVRSEPTRATVFLDGEIHKEPTPVTIERVPAGEHRVRIERDGYAARDTVVTIAPAEIAALDLALVPIEEARAPAPFWKKRWVQLAAGGVFGAGLLLALSGGGGDGGGEEPLGDLPGFPEPPHR